MSSKIYRPRRSMRIEILQLLSALAMPAAILAAFPCKALAPSAVRKEPYGAARSASCAFVSLSPDEERRVMNAARSAWQIGSEGVRNLRLEMFAEEIPEAPMAPVADISMRSRVVRSVPMPRREVVPPTDFRAPAPAALAPDAPEPARGDAFSREEMLNLDGTMK